MFAGTFLNFSKTQEKLVGASWNNYKLSPSPTTPAYIYFNIYTPYHFFIYWSISSISSPTGEGVNS